MSEETAYMSGPYQIELLKSNNRLPWKRHMLAVLWDQKLESYIKKNATPPEPKDPKHLTEEERKAIRMWTECDHHMQLRIELSIGDAEMVHIISTTMASQMWRQLTLVKEAQGKIGILMARKALYRSEAEAEEGVDLVEHISMLCRLQEELHLMGNLVSDDDFTVILLLSLLGSWDTFVAVYLGSKTEGTMLTLHELVALLLEEER